MSDDDRPKKRRGGRYLLQAVALSTGTMLAGCGSHQAEEPTTGPTDPPYVPLPGNPKGSVYDEGTQQPDETEQEQTEERTEPEEPEPARPLPLPANPKGAVYDDGVYGDDEPRRG